MVSIVIHPSSLSPSWGTTRDFSTIIPFSDGPDGQQSWLTVTESVPGTATASLVIYDLDNSINIARLSLINIAGLFTGYVQKVTYRPRATYRIIALSCVDLTAVCDTTLVGAVDGLTWWTDFVNRTVTAVDPNAYLSGGTDVQIIQNLFAAYWRGPVPIDTTTYVQSVNSKPFGPGAPQYGLPTNANENAVMLSSTTLKGALDTVASATGPFVVWWIDPNACLHWASMPQPGAPIPPGAPAGGYGNVLGLFPQGTLTNPPIGPAAYNLSDDGTGQAYENMEVEFDDTASAQTLYCNGATGFTFTPYSSLAPVNEVPPLPMPIDWWQGIQGWGATGWVNEDRGTWLSRYIDVPDATTDDQGDMKGSVAMAYMKTSLVRGKCDVLSTTAVHAGEILTVTNHSIPAPLPGPPASYNLNPGFTTLASAITSAGSTTITVTNDVTFTADGMGNPYVPPPDNVPVMVDSEKMTVTDGLGTNIWTVTRGVGGTTATTHANGALVFQSPPATAAPGFMLNSPQMIQRVTNTYVSGEGLIRASIEFGTAPLGSLGLRRQAAPKRAVPSPATGHDVQPSSATALPGQPITFHMQLMNAAGQPWRIAGKQVTWTVAVFDAAGTTVAADYTMDPSDGISWTNADGMANMQLTVGTTPGHRYRISTSTPD